MERKACWQNLYLICTVESCLMCLSTDQGSKLVEERETIHFSNHEFVSIYFPLPHYGQKVFLENGRTVLGY